MKLLLDDKATRGYNLNANEACVFAAILKCTRAGRGWYGNYRELAAAMPFVMSHETARRAVQKLLNLGLIERREEKLFAVTQIVTDDAQNVTEPTQNAAVADTPHGKSIFSDRECDVIRTIVLGKTVNETADKLCISASTVKTHLQHIYEKAGVRNRTELVNFIQNHPIS